MSDKQTYLFTLTITPVQSFISQARKTKDLFVGSEILSNLMREVINEFNTNGEIIFPQNTDFVSNKFVGKLNKTKEEIEKIGDNLTKCINEECINLVFKHTKVYDRFYENFFQVFWVAVKLEDNKYQKSYKKLEQNLGAVKNLRIFNQLDHPKGARKCSLCGERNGAFYKYGKDKNGEDVKPKYISKRATLLKEDNIQEVDINQIKDNETFCPICFTKRFSKGSFPSTEDISNEKKYYALIQFDIDDMGVHLSNAKDIKAQRNLSEKIGEFGQKVKNIVSKKYTIYAGGDDFLGFVELNSLFNVMKEIKEVSPKGNLTFSTSIVIAHDKAPLHKVLDFSRELLDETKNHFDDKNGVGIVVMSNSAINSKTICRYDDFCLLEELKTAEIAMSLHYKLHTIFSFLDKENKIDENEVADFSQMLKYEIKRLLKREQGEFNQDLYKKLIVFLDNQVEGLDTKDNITINFENFISYLKTLEQFKKVM